MLYISNLVPRTRFKSRFLVCLGAIALLLAAWFPQEAHADVQIVSLASDWHYQQTNNLDGINWQSPGYEDSNWPSGNALLYVENNFLVMPRNTPLTIGRTTYYFRKHFVFPVEVTNVFLSVSAYIDDGAAFYLNGQEVQRIRMPASPASIAYTNLATGTPAAGDATAPDTFVISGSSLTNLLAGDNVLAIEVHQNLINSDDIVFGASVLAKFTNSPPVLIRQPTDIVVVDGRSAIFSALIDGNPSPAFQWFKSGVAVPNATNSTLIFPAAYPADAGTYSLVATNTYGTLMTTNVVLSVLDDTNPPVILSAVAQKNGTNISIAFSEAVMPSTLTASNNYEIFQSTVPTNHLPISNLVASGSSGVILTTAPRIPGVNYTLRVNGLRDISSVGNQIAANSEIPLSYQVDLLPVYAQTLWKFYPVAQLPGTNWTSPAFDDSSWTSGAPIFQAGSPLPNTTDPLLTILPLNTGSNAFQTYYFRTSFDLPGAVTTNSIRLRDVADDGAIFYLNGSEVFSVGMPTNRPVDYATGASRSVSTAVYEPPLGFPGWSITETNLGSSRNFFAAEVHQYANGLSDVAFSANLEATISGFYPHPQLSIPTNILEGSGTLSGQGMITILEPLSSDLILQLNSSSPGDISVPASIGIPAGETNAVFDLVVGENALVDGPRSVTLTATGSNVVTASTSAQILDNETNLVSLAIASTISETNQTIFGEVHLSQPSINSIAIALVSSDPALLNLPTSVMMPAGATSVAFQASVADDLLLNGARFVSITASVPGWTTASTTVQVNDNEAATIDLQLPAVLSESSGTSTNASTITLGGIATSNITVSLQLSEQNTRITPGNVTIFAGTSNVVFSAMVDNLKVDGDRPVTISASAAGFASASKQVTVVDNDPDHIRFGTVSPLVDTNTVFNVQITALNADGSVQTNFNGSLSMIAQGLEGLLPVVPTNSGNFFRGQLYLNCRVAAPGHAVRLGAVEYPGQSDAFNVIPPSFIAISQPVADIVWHAASQTLLASVPASASTYSNCIVAIDPATGLVTNAYPVAYDPSQMEISPDGSYLYVAISNRTILQRFDLSTRTAGLKVSLGATASSYRFAYDFCIPPGFPNSVVVAARDSSAGSTSLAGIWRYDNGVAVSLPTLTASGGWRTESLNTGREIIVTPPLVRGDAGTGTILASATSTLGKDMNFLAGQVFDDQGNFYTSTDLRLLGSFPNVIERLNNNALPAVNSALRRVFYLAGYFNFGQSIYKLKVYDRDSLQSLLELPVPATPGTPTRFLQWNTNGLAYVTSNSQLWFIRPEAVQPADPAAELGLSFSSLPSTAVVGADYTFSISLSNAGPGTASLVRVTNALPVNATLVQTSPSSGVVTPANSAFTWNVAALPAGSNATLQVTLRFNSGGWLTNSTWALGFEADQVGGNNSLSLPLFVQLPPDATGAFVVNYSAEDLIYDPARDRLLLSVGSSTTSNQVNGLAVFNPYNGVTESFTALGKRPSRIVRTYDGQSLYVSLPDDALVRRLDLPTLSQNLEFGLGGEYVYGVWYPYYANDFASVPGDPDSLVAFRVIRPGPMVSEYGEGLALFQNGIMRSNVTQIGGSWKVEYDTDTGTLFGFSLGDLRRCSVDANGITFAQQYPPFASYSAGSDIEYAAGHLFTTTGKMVDLQPFRLGWVFAGAESATLVEPDAASQRVFYLVQTNGWRVNAYDMNSKLLLGSVAIPNVVGTPGSLIRWGTNGLAFRTSSNQLCVIRSPLISPNAGTDIAVSFAGSDQSVPLGSNAVFTLTITNQGTVPASHLRVTNTFSSAVALGSVTNSSGTSVITNGALIWTIASLDAGASATLSFAATMGQGGVFTATAAASSDTPDFQPGNNKALNTVLVGTPSALDKAVSLQLPINGMVWSPSLNRLLVTSSTNMASWAGALLSVDPITLDTRYETSLGGDAGRLAISRDGSVLYAGVDYGVSTITLPGLMITNQFLINPVDPWGSACDMEVVPGQNNVIAIGSKKRSDNSTLLSVYDSGIQRTNTDFFYSTAISLEFGADSSILYSQDSTATGFHRYTVDAQGLELIDSDGTLNPAYTPADIVWDSGRIYSSIGRVINPSNHTIVGTIAGIPAGSLVVYDSRSARVFYLCPGANQAVLRAFDGTTLQPAGSSTITGLSGSLTNFVRWGLNGFAFSTTSGQLISFRSSLVPTNLPADVGVSLKLGPAPYVVGSNIQATITITNSGPNLATDVAWSNLLPVGTIIANASASAGNVVISSNTASGVLPTLAVGASATVNVTFTASTSSVITNQVSVSSSSTDPNFANNASSTLLWILPFSTPPAVMGLDLSVKDIERDPVRPVLYASFGANAGGIANSVAIIDPVNGSISSPVQVGSDPGKLAASPDGKFLYVALDGEGIVKKLALPNLNPVGSFAVPQNQTVSRMVVSPTNSDVVVIRRMPDALTSLHIAGVHQPGELGSQDLFAFSQTSGQLFGCDGYHSNVKLYQLNAGTNGLGLLDSQAGKQSNSTDLKSSGALLFFNGGMIVNPDTRRVCAMMPVPYNSLVEPDTTAGRAFYLTPAGGTWTLRAFDIAQGIEVGNMSFSISGSPQRLLRWGADGFAISTTNSQIFIVRGQLIPTNPPIDLVIHQSVGSPSATTNDTLNISLQLTNLGPVTASGVVVTQAFSLPVTNLTLGGTLGSATYTNGIVTWQVGNLSTGVVASLNVSLRVPKPGTLTVSANAYHNLNDSFWGNNTALNTIDIINPAATNVLQIQLATRDLVYDPLRDRIYASTPATNRLAGNLVAVIDPATGLMERTFAAGSEPNQLAISEDSRFLYSALDGAMGAQRFDLQSNIADLSFSFGTNDMYFAQDFKVQPGHPETIAVSLASLNFASGYPSDIVSYDAGMPRKQKGGPSRGITFSADGSDLFGYVSPGFSYGLVRMKLGIDGFISTETLPAFTSTPGDLKFSNGRIYSSSGQVIDPYVPALIGSFSASGPDAIDPADGRAFYLAQKGASWELRAFDLATLQPTGTQVVANVLGSPGSLIRCGADRLAFRTSSNQLFIVRSPVVVTNLAGIADLAVSQSVTQDFSLPNETLQFTITVTNRGPSIATNVLVAVRPPASVQSLAIQLPQGTSTQAGANYLCNLGALPAGQSLNIVVSSVITNTAGYTNFASVSASTVDPDFSNNTTSLDTQGFFFQRSDSTKIYSVATAALAYDAAGQRLFAAMASNGTNNQIAWFDPQTGSMMGSKVMDIITPDSMLITEDNQYLYLSSNNSGKVQRIHLPSLTVDLSFTPPGAVAVPALALVPGSPKSVVITYWTNNIPITAIFDDATPRPDQIIGSQFKLLAAADDATSIFGWEYIGTGVPDVYRMSLSSSGLQPMDHALNDTPWGNQSQMIYNSGHLFFSSGSVMNPSTWAEEQGFSLPYWGVSMTVIPNAGEIAFLTSDSVSGFIAHITINSISSRQPSAQIDVRLDSLGFGNLTYCGADRFAFRSASELVFVRASAVPASDLALRASLSTNQVMVGETVNLQLVVSNAGPYAVSGVFLTNNLPAGFNIISNAVTQGTVETSSNQLVAAIGSLPINGTAMLNLVLSPGIQAPGRVTISSDVFGSTVSDPIPFNNHTLQQLLVLPKDSDHDGLPDDWELAHGLDPFDSSDAQFDSDLDGKTNLQEYLAGTDPQVFDGLRIVSLQFDRDEGWLKLVVHGAIGRTYAVETSTNLTQWAEITSFACTTDNQEVTILPSSAPGAFYRLRSSTHAP